MSETKARISNPFDQGMSFAVEGQNEMIPMQRGPGPAVDAAEAAIVTAQRVAVKRNIPAILQEARALATAAARKFYYSIPFQENDAETGKKRTTNVEGPSIDCAMAAVNCYGNCRIEAFPAREDASTWTFMARFTDYEKGVTVMRSFRQRKSQNVGLRDRGRSEDIVFQIGQSKAMRNVVVAALSWLTDEMFTAAKTGVLDRINNNPDGARSYILKELADLEIGVFRVERVVGRKAHEWLAPEMAKLFAEIRAIRDGFAHAEDLYPSDAQVAQERNDADRAAAEEKPEPKDEKPTRQARKPAGEKVAAAGVISPNTQATPAAEPAVAATTQAAAAPSEDAYAPIGEGASSGPGMEDRDDAGSGDEEEQGTVDHPHQSGLEFS